MKVQEILDKIDAVLTPVDEALAVFGLDAVPGLAIAKASLSILRKIFANKPSDQDYTQEMIDAEVDSAKEDILVQLDRMGITFDEDTGAFTEVDNE